MTTDNVQLEVQNVNPADQKTYYKPVILKVGGTSQYRDTEFFFGNVPGYWDSSHAKGDGLTIGNWVKVALSTKEKPDGPNPKPGALYRDIVQVRPATEDEIPDSPPQESNRPQNGSQDDSRAITGDFNTGMAFNQACTLVAAMIGHQIQDWDENIILATVARLRSRLYHDVLMRPIHPESGIADPFTDELPEAQEEINDLPF